MSRIRVGLRQPLRGGRETAPDQARPQGVHALGLVENPALRRAHVAHGLLEDAGGVSFVTVSRFDCDRAASICASYWITSAWLF